MRGCKNRLEASPLGYRLARGAFWSLAGSIIARGLALLSGIAVARILGKQGFGELNMIQSTLGLFGIVAGFGLGMTATRYVAEFRQKDSKRAARIIALSSATSWFTSGLMALMLVILAPWIATRALAAPQLAGSLRLGALLLLFGGVNSAQNGALSGFEAFKAISRISLLTGLLAFPVVVAGAWMAGVTGALCGLVSNYGFNCWLNWLALREEAAKANVALSYRSCLREWGLFWRFNVPGVLNALALSFGPWVCSAMLVQQADGYSDMGVFNAVKRFRDGPELLVGMLMAPMLPVLSEAFGRKDWASYGKTLAVGYATCTLLIIPAALLQLAAPWLTLLPFGKGYQGNETVVCWIMAGSVLYGLIWPMGAVVVSMGQMWLVFGVILSYICLYVVLGVFLIPDHGAIGCAAAWTISFAVGNGPCVVFLYSRLGGVMRRIQWAEMACFSCGLLLLLWWVSSVTTRIVGLTLGLVAVVTFVACWLYAYRKVLNAPAGVWVSERCEISNPS